MTTARQIFRCVQRLRQVTESGTKALNISFRSASTLTKKKYIEGKNGERIFLSPYGEYKPVEMLIPDYIWRNYENYGNKIALECGVSGRKYTYSEARDASHYIARSLLNMGLQKGDVVALIAPNYPETILGFLGALEAEMVVTTVNPFYTADEISKQMKSSGTKVVITAAEIASTAIEAARSALPGRAPIVVIEDGTKPIPDGVIPFKDLIERGRSLPSLSRKSSLPDDLAVLPYSSGTTGLPKGVMLSHNNLIANMEMLRQSTEGEIWQSTTESFQEVLPLFLPFFHIFGMNAVALPRLFDGSKLVTLPKFTPNNFVNILEKEKVTGLFCVPPIILFLAASELIKKSHLERIHHIFSGAAPLSQPDVERLYKRFGIDESTLKFCQGYGLTECSPVSCMEKTGLKYSSIGKTLVGCEARLVDPITNEDVCTTGKTGELWIRGPHVMKGYLNNEAATKETIVDGCWLKSGDVAYFDEDLDFFITDRLKELIKVKGFQVPPAELEALLRTHPDVEEAAVIGIPDERCGEVPKAFVLPKKGRKLNAEEIKNFVKGKVSEYKELQGGVTFVDSIPKNPSGKILRIKLKNEYS